MSLVRNTATIDSIIQQVRRDNPPLAEALRFLNKSILDIQDQIDPIVAAAAADTEPEPLPQVVDSFTYELRSRSVHFAWTSSDPLIRLYELRKGTVWETAEFVLRTASLSVDIEPIAVGSHTYLLRTINGEFGYSELAQSLIVTVPPIGTVTVAPQVIDNTVLLYWTEPTSSFEIVYYIIDRILSGVRTTVGKKQGTFTTIEETVSGTYTYIVIPVDYAGNIGGDNSVTVEVRQPPDFELLAETTSTLTGTKTNAILYDPSHLLVAVDTAEDYDDHFTNNGWLTPQDQIDDGYPIFIQPSLLTAEYKETFDFGTIISNTIINIQYALEEIVGSFTVTIGTEVSDDNVSFAPSQPGPSVFVTSVRYARITFTFTPTADTDLALFSNLRVTLDVKREMDSGTVTANAGDANGTTVTFNKSFKDVNSLTVTPRNPIEPITVVEDFVDAPNPTTFKVRAYDSSGVRVTHLVDWKARGIV